MSPIKDSFSEHNIYLMFDVLKASELEKTDIQRLSHPWDGYQIQRKDVSH